MMDKLPNEILAKIFSYLQPQALHNISQVCISWSRATKSLGICQLDFSGLGRKRKQSGMIERILKEIPSDADGGCIRHLLIRHRSLLPHHVFSFIQRLCPNVISFDYDYDLLQQENPRYYYNQFDRDRHRFLVRGWNNTIAHLPACHDSSERWSYHTGICQRLESLTLQFDSPLWRDGAQGYCNLDTDFPTLPRLTSLTLDKPEAKFKETLINAIHQHCPKLTKLTLRDAILTCIFCRDHAFDQVERNLHVLKLENVVFLNRQTFDYFPRKYPNVQPLLVSIQWTLNSNRGTTWSPRLYYRGIKSMIMQFKYLTHLVVRVQDDELDEGHDWFQNKMQTYQRTHKHINVDVRFI